MREQLLGYLLGALDGPEHDQVKRELQRDPQLQGDLQRLEDELAPLESQRWQPEPPAGLVERTCQLVSKFRCGRGTHWLHLARGSMRDLTETAPATRGGSLVDMVVAAGIFFAAAIFFFPAIASSRHDSRRVACGHNLREVGTGLQQYSNLQQGCFPHVPATGNLAVAGIYGPKLFEARLLTEPRRLICPASSWAERRGDFDLPTVQELEAATSKRLVRLQRMAGGSYGYTFGHMDGDQYVPVRNLCRAYFALMSDAPDLTVGIWTTANHGKRGFNVLFEDMHVSFVVSRRDTDARADDVFRNDRGRIEAGLHADDSVIGRSAASPFHVTPMPATVLAGDR